MSLHLEHVIVVKTNIIVFFDEKSVDGSLIDPFFLSFVVFSLHFPFLFFLSPLFDETSHKRTTWQLMVWN